MRRGAPLRCGLALTLWGATAGAQAATKPMGGSDTTPAPPHARATSPAADAAAAPSPPTATKLEERGPRTCTEHLAGATERPPTTEHLAEHGTSGYTADLVVEIVHGRGETVLPTGFRVKLGDELEALEKAGFYLTAGDGGTAPSTVTTHEGSRAKTTLTIPFLLLPPKPGRQTLTLPPVPVAVARASGAVITLCTKPHTVLVEDPTANDPHAIPKGNPAPRAQLEEWTAAKNAAIGALAALVFGALVATLVTWWLRRERPVPPPPPPRPPWEVALEELFDIEQSRLVEQGRFAVQFDRVSHAVRQYLGDRYGFEGLESTTREIMAELSRFAAEVPVMPTIEDFLTHADLVKFAKATPTEAECVRALERGREIVERTIPTPERPAPPEATAAAAANGKERP